MKLERDVLLAQLRILRPALADKSPVEGLNQIWFSGDKATAFNDIIAIEVPCESGVEGGVNGGTLLGMLEASAAKEVEIGVNAKDGETLSLRAAGMKADFPILPLERAIFSFPATLPKGVDIDDALGGALKHVALALSSAGDNMGVTFVVEGAQLATYATDGTTIAWARVPKPKGYAAKRLVLSPTFCDQLSALNEGGMSLSLMEDCAVAVDNQSGVRLFGRLVEVAKDLDFAGVVKTNVPNTKSAVPLPDKLASALARAEVLVTGVQRTAVEVGVKKGVLRLHLKTDLGELSEAITLAGKHPDVDSLFNGSFIARGLSRSKTFMVSDQCFAMLGEGDSGFLVAVSVG